MDTSKTTDSSNSQIRKGDFLVDFGQVFQITSVEPIKTDKGQDRLLVFKPFYKTGQEAEITSSIPESNLERTTIRKPLSKKDIENILSMLSDKKIKKEIVDVLTAKAILNQNDPTEITQTIRKLFLEKGSKDGKFTSSKKYIYRLLISRLAEEVALAFNITPAKAETKIENKLKK